KLVIQRLVARGRYHRPTNLFSRGFVNEFEGVTFPVGILLQLVAFQYAADIRDSRRIEWRIDREVLRAFSTHVVPQSLRNFSAFVGFLNFSGFRWCRWSFAGRRGLRDRWLFGSGYTGLRPIECVKRIHHRD